MDVNVERAQDVLLHKRLLHMAHDPATRPAVQVRLVQVIYAIHNENKIKIKNCTENSCVLIYAGSFFFWFKLNKKSGCSMFWLCRQTEAWFIEKLFGLVVVYVKPLLALYVSHMPLSFHFSYLQSPTPSFWFIRRPWACSWSQEVTRSTHE